MKKKYLLLFTLGLFLTSFAQSPIVTIDRENITGPTATGNAASISSVGLTRGNGVIQRNGNDFSARDWMGTSQATAESNEDYLEWSVTANVNYDIEITEIDVRLRRNLDGPTNWQLFYSTDDFTTAGISVNTAETLAANSNVIFNLNGLSINSGTSGTITFRLYAWNAATASGWLRVRRLAAWSDFGIALPGIRLTGNVTTSSSNSSESNIVSSIGFDPSDNINYQMYSATFGLTTGNSLKIGEFTIQDGGDDLTDSDALNTILNDISFSVLGDTNLAALAIFDGTTNVSEVTSITPTTLFSAINGGSGLVASDGAAKTFDVYATFNTNVTDNQQIQLTVSSAIPDASGSTFDAFDAGAASTSVAGDDNRLEVTATAITFIQEPSDVNRFETMTPYPTINAIDSNSNLDLDFNDSVSILSNGPLDPPSSNYNFINGEAVLDNIMFSDEGTDFYLLAITSGFLIDASAVFDVVGPIVTIAVQDFDSSSPEWTYTNDVLFFDNGWGTDGYYGIIDSSVAAPLDYTFFENNILGENDLNDEGDNGTTGWATIQFDDVDISGVSNVQVRFDWQVIGYVNNNDNAQYQLFYDGVGQGQVFLFDGDNGSSINDGSGSIVLDIPDVVNTVSLAIRVRDNGPAGFSGFDNFKVVSVFDGLIYTDNAWTPNPPSGSTGSENALIKDGNYIVGENIALNNLFIENDATVTVAQGQSIQINGDLHNAGVLELNSVSTSYSSLIIEGKSNGEVVYNRHVNTNAETGGNDLVSAPVTGQTFGDFALNNPNLFSNPSNPTEKLFGPFDKATDTYLTYDTAIPAEASVVLSPAVGYRAASSDGGTLAFTGEVNTEDVDIAIVYTGPTNTEWNLIGNPYPSYISLSDFLSANNSVMDPVSSGVYGYDGDASDGWTIWNQAYSDANPGAVITPGQGFLVASVADGGTVSFSTSMRRTGTTDDFISGRTSNNSLIEHLKLELSSLNDSYNTDFYFTDNATLGLDPGYDASIYSGVAPSFSIYSHLIEDNQDRDYAIQSLDYNAISDVTIPLGINANQNQEITVSIVESTLPEDIDVYLDDIVGNTSTLLNNDPFIITPDSDLSQTGRFFLRFSGSALSTEEHIANNNVQVFATITPKSLFVKGNLDSLTTVKIHDLQGRLVLETNLDSTSTNNQVDLSNIVSGVYTVSLTNKTLSKTQKIIIK